MYSADLAYVHDAGFGDYAQRAAPEIERLLKRHSIRDGRIVELGCGAGTVASRLVDAGYDVLGIDQSAEMVRIARMRAPGARFRVGSLATARLPACRAIVAIGEVVSYLADRSQAGPAQGRSREHEDDLVRFFSRASRALQPGGLLIFDFMCSSRGRIYPLKSRRGADWAITLTAGVDRSGRLLSRRLTVVRRVNGRVRRTLETHRLRIYPRATIAAMLREAGFAVTLGPALGRMRLMKSDALAVARRGRE